MDKIKIALCLSGEPRNSMASFPYIYESFLTPNSNYKTDVYLHAWEGFRALSLYSPKKYIIEKTNELRLFKNFFKNLNLKPSFKKQLKHFFTFSIHSNQIKNTYLMFYSVKKSFDLINEPYDIYIRCRYDYFFEQKFYINNIIKNILDNKYDMFIPYINNDTSINNHFNDQLAIGNYKSFKCYSNIISNSPCSPALVLVSELR